MEGDVCHAAQHCCACVRPLHTAHRWLQGAALGAGGAVTAQLACGGPAAPGALWQHRRQFVCGRLLALVALAKRVLARGPLTEHLANACSALVALYGVRLMEEVPRIALPALTLYAQLWQVFFPPGVRCVEPRRTTVLWGDTRIQTAARAWVDLVMVSGCLAVVRAPVRVPDAAMARGRIQMTA